MRLLVGSIINNLRGTYPVKMQVLTLFVVFNKYVVTAPEPPPFSSAARYYALLSHSGGDSLGRFKSVLVDSLSGVSTV